MNIEYFGIGKFGRPEGARCPTCLAAPFQPCRTKTGKTFRDCDGVTEHASRLYGNRVRRRLLRKRGFWK